MKRHISICHLLNCRSVSGLHIRLEIQQPLSSAIHFSCEIATGKGSFKSCIMRMWDRNQGSIIFLRKLQTEDDRRNRVMLDGGSVTLQGKTRGIFVCRRTRRPYYYYYYYHYYYIEGNEWYTYSCPCQIMFCEHTSCDAVTFMEFYINSYITKHPVIENL